jgi:hypothetical protein
MEGTRMKVPAQLAAVVRSFLASRLERELLAQAFELASRGPATIGRQAQQEEPRELLAGHHPSVRRKGA